MLKTFEMRLSLRLDERLLRTLWEADQLGPTILGTVSVNHDGCPAGEDTRRRLYVTRKEDGTLLGYCHNCGSRGVSFGDMIPNIHSTSTAHDAVKGGPYVSSASVYNKLPSMHSILASNVPPALSPYPLHLMQKDHWSVGVAQGLDFVVFPCYTDADNVDGTLTGVQMKYLATKSELDTAGITTKCVSVGKVGVHLFDPCDSDTVVICEDRISGVAIADAGYAACVLHGSKLLSAEDCHSLATVFHRIVVWLDNDNPTVEATASSNAQRLSLFSKSVGMVTEATDPKHYSKISINETVEKALTHVI